MRDKIDMRIHKKNIYIYTGEDGDIEVETFLSGIIYSKCPGKIDPTSLGIPWELICSRASESSVNINERWSSGI